MTQHIELSGACTIYEAAAVQIRLMEALNHADTLVVDLSGISEADASFFQLLISARAEARRGGKRLEWAEPSEAVQSLCHALHCPGALEASDTAAQGGAA